MLLGALNGENIGKYNELPTSENDKIENMKLALSSLKGKSALAAKYKPKEFVENPNLINSLVAEVFDLNSFGSIGYYILYHFFIFKDHKKQFLRKNC